MIPEPSDQERQHAQQAHELRAENAAAMRLLALARGDFAQAIFFHRLHEYEIERHWPEVMPV